MAATRAAGPEDMIADLVDGVIQPLERPADPFPGQLSGLACGRVQAQPDVEQAAHDPVQQVLGVLRLLREHDADQVGEVVLPVLLRGVSGDREAAISGARSSGSLAVMAASTEEYSGTSRSRPSAASSRRTAGAVTTSRSSAWQTAARWQARATASTPT